MQNWLITILKLKHMKLHVSTRKYLFITDAQKPEQVAQKCCGVSLLGDIQNMAGDGPGQPALCDPVNVCLIQVNQGLRGTISAFPVWFILFL